MPYHPPRMNPTPLSAVESAPATDLAAARDNDQLLAIPESLRARFFADSNAVRQRELAQFLTPPHVANLMAGMFGLRCRTVRLIDAGAGLGILSAAFIRRQLLRKVPPVRIEVVAYEMDSALISGLDETYAACREACRVRGVEFHVHVHNGDFLAEGAAMLRRDLFGGGSQTFDAAIVNPPYGKLSTASSSYRMLQAVDCETVNLYTAFVNLLVALLRPQGEIVAITPRSFCNGPYFKPFRRRILKAAPLRRIHVFESRTAAFKHDSVLQENVILHAVKGGEEGHSVQISQSAGHEDGPVRSRVFPADEVVSPGDPEAFIHIPTSQEHLIARDGVLRLGSNLAGLGLQVSTGRVVDFRARDHLRQDPTSGAIPLIYPCHFGGLYVSWPKDRSRMPNAIMDAPETRNLFVPSGVYVLTKRFTSKEERRRVVACVFNPDLLVDRRVAFENHLNYIHADGQGLDMLLAKGLWTYLNSSMLDLYFRQFNGHTQVNATDLRNVRFPTAAQLRRIGRHIGEAACDQASIDSILARELKP